MTERDVLVHRRATLTALLATPSGPLGPNAGLLGDRIRSDWQVEVRLIDRLLSEAHGDAVMDTIAAWRERTTAFAARSPVACAQWTDRHGTIWEAGQVLGLLDDLAGRVASWVLSSGEALGPS